MKTKAEADKKAREILSLAIQRLYAADFDRPELLFQLFIFLLTTLRVVSLVVKEEIFESFEQITGTNLIIDDTPECVTVSSHDPVRREIASVTMENLISDGRIQGAVQGTNQVTFNLSNTLLCPVLRSVTYC